MQIFAFAFWWHEITLDFLFGLQMQDINKLFLWINPTVCIQTNKCKSIEPSLQVLLNINEIMSQLWQFMMNTRRKLTFLQTFFSFWYNELNIALNPKLYNWWNVLGNENTFFCKHAKLHGIALLYKPSQQREFFQVGFSTKYYYMLYRFKKLKFSMYIIFFCFSWQN